MDVHNGIFVFRGIEVAGSLTLSSAGNDLILIPTNNTPDTGFISISQDVVSEELLNGVHIHGRLDSGSLVTLPGALLIGRKIGISSSFTSSLKFRCPVALVGDVCFENRYMTFDAMRIELSNFSNWMNESGVTFEFEDESMLIHLKSLPLVVCKSLNATENEFSLLIKQASSVEMQKGEKIIKESHQIWILSRDSKNIEWFVEIERLLWLFVNALTGFSTQIEKSNLYLKNEFAVAKTIEGHLEYENWVNNFIGSDETSYELKLIRTLGEPNIPNEIGKQLSNSQMFENIEATIARWFEVSGEINHIVGLLVAATKNEPYYVESKLANLAQALEALHRYKEPDKTAMLPRSEFKRLKKHIEACFPPEFLNIKAQFIGRLGNINSISIRERLTDIFQDSIKLITAISDFSNANDVAVLVGEMRNNISHGNSEKTYSGVSLTGLNNLISTVLRFQFLKILGLPESEAVTACTNYYLSQFSIYKNPLEKEKT